MSEEELKQIWDNLFNKLDETEKTYLAIVSNEKNKEIERLGNELQVQIEDNTRLNEYIEAQDKKLQQKEKIIKEVREYKKQLLFDLNRQYKTFEKWEEILDPIDYILDKENKE